MKIRFTYYILILGIINCSEKSPKNNGYAKKEVVVASSSLIDLLWGRDVPSESLQPGDSVVYNLNKSNYKDALGFIKTHFVADSLRNDRFNEFQYSENASGVNNYILYRLNDYFSSDIQNELEVQLIKSMSNSPDELNILQTVEYRCLQVSKIQNAETRGDLINDLLEISSKYPDSKRIKYLLGIQYLRSKNLEKAISVLDKLIKEDYYSLLILRAITDYLSLNNISGYDHYYSAFTDRFPKECRVLHFIKMSPDEQANDSLPNLCTDCIKSQFGNDSIFAQLNLATYYLSKGLYEKVDSLYSNFANSNETFALDSMYLFERGTYYDLKMKSLYAQGKYTAICNFIKNEMGYNSIVNFEKPYDLKVYIKQLFYMFHTKSSNFEVFFSNNFKCSL